MHGILGVLMIVIQIVLHCECVSIVNNDVLRPTILDNSIQKVQRQDATENSLADKLIKITMKGLPAVQEDEVSNKTKEYLNATTIKIDERMDTLKHHESVIDTRITQLKEDNDAIIATTTDIKTDVGGIKTELGFTRIDIRELQKTSNKIESKIEATDLQLGLLNLGLGKAKDDISNVATKLDGLLKKTDGLTVDVKELNSKTDSVQTKLDTVLEWIKNHNTTTSTFD